MSFEPVLAESIETLDPPTEEELEIFRGEMDVGGQFSGASGSWIAREEDGWTIIQENG